ncbi:MAG: hypothetical protein ACFB2W_13385 [Leptolyngbyaceae cyanobacterium]
MSDASDHATRSQPDKETTETPGPNEVTQLVEQLIKTKRITYAQYQTLSTLVLADGTIDEQERRQINRLFDAIQVGAVRIVEQED